MRRPTLRRKPTIEWYDHSDVRGTDRISADGLSLRPHGWSRPRDQVSGLSLETMVGLGWRPVSGLGQRPSRVHHGHGFWPPWP